MVKYLMMSKKKVQGTQAPRSEAYIKYAAVTRGAAQHRNWAFYEAI